MSWNVCRSPIHGLGSWLAANACTVGRLSALFARWYSYSQLVEPALVIGVQKLNPCGTAVAGTLLPRENPPVELVPRVVIAYSAGLRGAVLPASTSVRSSSQPRNTVGP